MISPRLPEVERLADEFADRVENSVPATSAAWQVDGPATAGKSAFLSVLAERLEARELVPLLVAPPPQALDAGPSAISEVAARLKTAGLVNGQTHAIEDSSRPMIDKIALVKGWLEEHSERVVMLLDEPAAWPDETELTGHFAEHARVVLHELVRDVSCRRVFTGDRPEAMRVADVRNIAAHSEPKAFLLAADAWGSLSDAAGTLWELGGERLRRFSPLQLRLLVAHVAVTSERAAGRLLGGQLSRRAISLALAESLAEQPEHDRLREAWRRLAQVRRSFSDALLAQLAGDVRGLDAELLKRCLLYRSSSGWVLHETLRRDADVPRSSSDPRWTEPLRALAEHYAARRREQEAEADGEALVSAMESFFYAARAGARDLLTDRPFFVDQLDLLGKTLSYEHRDFAGAADVFQRAVELDGEDDYANHYLAFNLDRLGRDPMKVEAAYRTAIRLNGRHTWWRARLIAFLITRGRTTDAEIEWDVALDEVGTPELSAPPRVYETLHGWVAATCLRRGLLGFADRVLADVPPAVRTDSPTLTALIRRVRALQLADQEGAFVPGPQLRPEWWRDGPALLQLRIGEDDRLLLRRWLAGRVEALSNDAVELRVRDVRGDGDEAPPIATMRLAREVFRQLNRDGDDRLVAGAFVEVGLYSESDGSDVQRRIRVHPRREWEDDAVMAPVGASDRYWARSEDA